MQVKNEILDVLNYWCYLDFMSQSSLPKPKKKPEIKKKKEGEEEKGKITSVSDVYKLGTPSSGSELNDLIKERLSGFPGAFDLESRFTYLHLGAIPREALISYFESDEDSAGKRIEREIDEVAAALLKISPEGAFKNFELSPLLWAASAKDDDGKIKVSEYEVKNKDINEDLAERFGSEPLGLASVAEIVKKHIAPYLEKLVESEQLNEAQRSQCLESILFDYKASTKEDFSYEVSFRSYYSKDIENLRTCVENADTLDAFENGQLSLVLHYLKAGLKHKSGGEKVERIDILSGADDGEADNKTRQLRFYQEALGYDSIPLGRWPSKYSLSLMQQVAIDLVAGRNRESAEFPANDIMSVNGPPGTGKTTLLKDIIAANVVDKARLLSTYENPDDAFKKVTLSKEKGYLLHRDGVYKLKDERINDLGIIVCSSNNTAVENISKELPDAEGLFDGIDEEEKEEFLNSSQVRVSWPNWVEKGSGKKNEPVEKRDLYFSYAAFNQFRQRGAQVKAQDYDDSKDSNLHLLLAARLGKRSNINDFLYQSLSSLPLVDDNRKSKNKSNYAEAQQQFNEQYEKVQNLFSNFFSILDRAEFYQCEFDYLDERIEELKADVKQEKAAYHKALQKGLDFVAHKQNAAKVKLGDKSLNGLRGFIEELDDFLTRLDIEEQHLERVVANADEAKKAVTEKKITFRHKKKLAEAKRELENARYQLELFKAEHRGKNELAKFVDELRSMLNECEEKASVVDELEEQIASVSSRIDETKRNLEDAEKEAKDYRPYIMGEGSAYPSITTKLIDDLTSDDEDSRKKAHLFNPAAGKALMRERDLLFLRALQLTREFILSSSKMKANLEYLCAYWGKKKKSRESGAPEIIKFDENDKKAMVPALFQTLNILTPVISTTFASVQAMFKDVTIEDGQKAPFGLLVIDEAGQAVPHAALGILSRCRKAMVVGDPFQVEPVVCQEAKALRGAMAQNIDPFYTGDTASVQKFADELNPHGQERWIFEGGQENSSWVGCPLVVHRRCVSPMFDISNEVSYQGSMLNETASLNPEKKNDRKKLNSFYHPSSQWLNVGGSERGNKNHYVEKQGKRVREIVEQAFKKLPEGETIPSLFIISPFKTVVEGIREALGSAAPNSDGGKMWGKFKENNIGTVHTFQGKEALEVVFVLGCDKEARGAVQFVNSNIVNVAASRAKERLYVVGDFNVWKDNEYVSKMKRILDTAWVKHWENYLDSGEKEELRLARQMLPVGESLPFKEVEAGANGADDKELVYDTEPYLENMSERTDRLLRDEKNNPVKCGFPSLDELESMFENCVDEDDNNRVLSNIKQGILLYEMFTRGPKVDDNFDLSFVLKMFDKAAEIYINIQALPALKRIVPDYKMPKKLNLKACENVTIGQYGRIVGDTLGARRLAWGTTELVGKQESPCADASWWEALSEVVRDFAAERNKAAHVNPVGLNDVNKALGCMGIRGETTSDGNGSDKPTITILKSDANDVYAALVEKDFGDVELPKFEAVENPSTHSNTAPPEPVNPELESSSGTSSNFSLADAEYAGSGDCCAATKLLKDDSRFVNLKNAGFNAGKIFDWLEEEGMIERGAINGASGRLPTESGAKLGIRWHRFENEGEKPSTGIYFNPEAQQWLAQNITALLEWKGGHAS